MANELRGKVLRGLAWSTLEKVGTQLIAFIVSVILARLLTPQEYGIVALTSVFMAISGVFVDGGFGAALVQKKDADELDFCTVMYSSIGIGVIIYLFLFFIAPYAAIFFHTQEFTVVLRIAALPFLWMGYRSALNSYFYRSLQYKAIFYRSLISLVCSAIVGITMAYLGYGVYALLAQGITSELTALITLQITSPWHPTFRYSIDRARTLMAFGGNVAGASLIGTAFNELKGLLIGRLYTPADLALFNKGGSFPRLIFGNINSILNEVLFPAMSRYGDDRTKVKLLVRRFMKTGLYVVFFLMTVIFASCEPLVRLVFSEKWVPCVPYMRIVCLQLMIEIIGFINMQSMKAVGEANTILKLEVYKKPVFLIMTVIGALISVYALAVTLPLYALYATYINISPNKRILNYSFREQLFDISVPIMLCAGMLVFIYPLSFLHLPDVVIIITQAAVGLVIYVLLSLLFNVESFYYLKDLIVGYAKKKL